MTMIGLGLMRPARGAGPGTGNETPTVLPTPLPRDELIYDSGAALGSTAAMVALSGTAPEGTQITARTVRAAAPSTVTDAPVVVATAGAGGTWSGPVAVERSDAAAPGWRYIEVSGDGGATWVRIPQRMAAGHVLALWQQSEDHHAVLPAHDQTTAPAITDPEAVQFFLDTLRDGNERQIMAADGASGMTAAMAAWAAQTIASAPGQKFALAYHVEGGTSWDELMDDGNAGRSWATDRAIHDLLTANGATPVGLAMAGWYASPRARGSFAGGYAQSLFAYLFGVDAGGTARPPATEAWDHVFTELYDYAHTRWMLLEPHRFEDGGAGLIDACRTTVRSDGASAWQHPVAAGRILPPGFAAIDYLNGEGDGGGGWTDTTHPAADTPEGVQRLQRYRALDAAYGLGLIAQTPPAIDTVEWEASGAWVELGSSAGPITTRRDWLAGAPALPGGYTQVAGITVNGAAAEGASIVNGRIRITKTGGFGPNDAVNLGALGGTGTVQSQQEMRDRRYLDYPVVDLGLPGDIGPVAVLPLPGGEVLQNTLGVTVMFAQGTGGSGPTHFRQQFAPSGPTQIGAGITALTVAFSVRVPALSDGNVLLAAINGFQLSLTMDARSSKRGGLVEAGGCGSISLPWGTFPVDTIVPIVITARRATATTASHLSIDVGGTLRVNPGETPAGTASQFSSTRSWQLLPNDAQVLDFSAIRIWHEAAAVDGEVPATPPLYEIGPGLADVIAHPWAFGEDAVAT